MDGWMDGSVDGWMEGWMDRWMDGWMDGWIDGWMDGGMDGWMDGWMNADRTKETLFDVFVLILGKHIDRAKLFDLDESLRRREKQKRSILLHSKQSVNKKGK